MFRGYQLTLEDAVLFPEGGVQVGDQRVPGDAGVQNRASSSYFFLFFSAYSYFSYFFSNVLLFFLFFSHFTYNKQIFVRDLNILSLFKYVVYRVH